LYSLGCWSSEPDNRPTINYVVNELKKMVTETHGPNADLLLQDQPQLNSNVPEDNNSLLNYNESSELVHYFDMNIHDTNK